MKRLIIVLTFMSLLMGCRHNRQEVLQPDDILQEEGIIESNPTLDATEMPLNQSGEEGIFILTVENDLFYLDPTLSQYKISDQVSYFDYDIETNSIKIQKKDQRWIVWFLDKMKPEIVPVAGDVKLLGSDHQIVYTDSENKQLSILKEGIPAVLFTGDIKIFDTTLTEELIVIQDQSDTLRVINSEGHVVYERESVHAYRLDKENRVMMIWAENQGIVLKLYDDSVTTYKIIENLTDWLMFPSYNKNFETVVHFSDLNLETGIGTMSISSQLSNQNQHVPNVLNFELISDGSYVFYLTDKYELYGLDVESGATTFLGTGGGQLSVHQDFNSITYKSEDILYLTQPNEPVQVIAEDVYQYEYSGQYMAYTNSIDDLYLESQGLSVKIDEGVKQFALGHQGVYYHKEGQIIYKPFVGPKEVIVDSNGNYKNIFFANTQLYQKELDVSAIQGYWMQEENQEVVLYYFDAQGQIEHVSRQGEQWGYLKGQYELMHTGSSVLSLMANYIDQSESYLTVSLIDSKTIQMADQDDLYELKSVSEREAMAVIEAAKEISLEE